MVKAQVDPETNDTLPPFGIENDHDGIYKKFKTPDMIPEILYLIKANAAINTEAYTYAQSSMLNGRVKFLIDESSAKIKLMSTKNGQSMSPEARREYLYPYFQTDILREQLLNLVQMNEGINIILKQSSRGISKDKFSAFIYGLYYIKQEEARRKNRHSLDVSKMLFFN